MRAFKDLSTFDKGLNEQTLDVAWKKETCLNRWQGYNAKATDKLMELKLRPKFMLVQTESFQETQHTAICCLWGCIAADHSRCQPLSDWQH